MLFFENAVTHCFLVPNTFEIQSRAGLALSQSHSLQNSGAKYVNNKMLRQTQNFSVSLVNASAKKTAKDLAETFVNYVSNGFGIPWYFAKGHDLFF